MTHSSAAETAPSTATTTATRALRVVATLSVLMIVLQGVSAGEILSRNRSAESLHFFGAIAVVVFAVGFVQAAIGEAGILAVHVPLAMLLLVGAVLVMVWSFRRTWT